MTDQICDFAYNWAMMKSLNITDAV
jgi:hypothetical protein